MKQYSDPVSSPVPDFKALDDMFLGTKPPVPDLDGPVHKVMIGPFQVEYIDGRKRGVGAGSKDNFQNHFKLKYYNVDLSGLPLCTHLCMQSAAPNAASVFATTDSCPTLTFPSICCFSFSFCLGFQIRVAWRVRSTAHTSGFALHISSSTVCLKCH